MVHVDPGPKTIREAPIIAGSSGGIGRRLVLIPLIFALFGLFALGIGDSVSAEPAAITEARSEAEALRDLIDDLEGQLGAAVEEYNYAVAMLAQTQADAEETQRLLTQAEEDLARADAQLAERLVQIYKQGELGVMDALLSADSVVELMQRVKLVQLLSDQDAQLVVEVRTYRDAKIARAAELAEQIEQQTAYAAEVETARARVEQRLAANERALAGKEAQIAQLVKEEAARQARLAELARKAAAEAARRARLQAAQRARARASTSPVSVPATVSASDVVNIALRYLGCKYVWAAAGPSSFDCSGLVMYVYAQVGVRLPHSSRMQYGCGVPVSRANLQPGDLIFFYTPIHHVAIYIGDGKMVHAAGVGKGVRVDTVWTRNYNSACRIVR
jgi:cell wall-associated NlpC family hydrolase